MIDFARTQNAVAELKAARAELSRAQRRFDDCRDRIKREQGLPSNDASYRDDLLLVPFVESIFKTAMQAFSIKGGALELDRNELLRMLQEKHGLGEADGASWRARVAAEDRISEVLWSGELSIADLWAGLSALLQSDETQQAARETAARWAAYSVGRSMAAGVQRTKGRVVIRHGVSVDTSFKCRLHCHSLDEYNRLVDGLIGVAEWAGLDGIAADMRGCRMHLGWSHEVVSRERFDLGGGVELITFKSSFEYRLPEALAVALGRFLNEYAAEIMEDHRRRAG
jgi:hypothetical protein